MSHIRNPKIKRILFFGIFNPEYSRTRIFTEGFNALGYEVVTCRVDPSMYSGLHKYKILWRQGRAIRNESFDRVFVLFPGHTVVWLARLLFGNRIIFDVFVSLYDSNVHDRARYSSYTLCAWRDKFLDWSSCALARKVLVDTKAHELYFKNHIGVSAEKLIVVLVGASTAWFTAGEDRELPPHNHLTVGFYGSYIPLHGITTIIRAAHLLAGKQIYFRLIGSGQEYSNVNALTKELGGVPSVEFIKSMPRDELIKSMRDVDVCLGIFGSTEKASRVIPNKVYECAALGKPIITADTPGVREAFTNQEDIILCAPASPEDLANAISELATHVAARRRLGAAARALMQKHYTPKRLVTNLLTALSK